MTSGEANIRGGCINNPQASGGLGGPQTPAKMHFLLPLYVGCSESSCNCVIPLVIFIRCTGKFVFVNFHLFLIVERKEKEK